MKKLLVFSCLAVFIFGVVGTADALMYYSDIYDPDPDVYLGGKRSRHHDTYSWTFDVTDDGFSPVVEDVVSAEVGLSLLDDAGCLDFWEFATLDIGENTFWWEVDTGDIAFTVASLMTLSDSGKVDCTLPACWGDFYFDKAVLHAEATDGQSAPVSEPSISLLLGCGFICICIASLARKRFFKKPIG